MHRSTERILTTHVGSLVRPPEIIEAMRKAEVGIPYDDEAFEGALKSAVADVVKKQVDVGIDVPSDGEFGKKGWIRYVTERLSGIEYKPAPPRGVVSATAYADDGRFRGFYERYREHERTLWLPDTKSPAPPPPAQHHEWVCTGKIGYRGQAAIKRDIANFKSALQGQKVADAFMPCVAPCSVEFIPPADIYKTEEEYVYAVAAALSEEYRAVVDAGFILQIDDAILPMRFVTMKELGKFKKWAQIRIDATNEALKGIPADRVRYHICWGSQNVPHTWDVPLKDIVDLLLQVNSGALSIEAANPRHEHEWQIWETIKLPKGKILIPGMVSHSTNVVEHPELIAWRIKNFARLVGRENVIAGSDCGFSQNWNLVRVHPEVQWAKLEALVQGAKLASRELWQKAA